MAGGRLVRPILLLARTPEEAAFVASSAPASATERLTSWNRFSELSLVLVTGGLQPDPSYRIAVRGVSVINAGKKLLATTVISKQGDAEKAFSVPWALVAIDARTAVLVTKCLHSIEGEAGIESRCR